MAMKVLKLAAALGSTLALAVAGATSAEATDHHTIVNGIEFQASSTQGSFSGTATGTGTNPLWGAWSIVVNHTTLLTDRCGDPAISCAHVTGGSFTLGVTSPSVQAISGTFDPQKQGFPGIVMVDGGSNCRTQLLHITDSLSRVGAAGGPHTGTGTFDAYLWHHRHWFFGQCVTYSATVKGNVRLDF
jgi:hypothetical protein